ncbi:MAG: RICIN domain-containing protein [Verrucomicrobia bacterium]|nr:RICIN domain-containing protein [Verrucomicrobiota bacterium]
MLRPKDANGATGTPIVLYSAQPWKCMSWRLQPAGDAAFALKNLFTSKTFAAGSETGAAQPAVTQVPLAKAEGESPAWQFTKLDDGSYKITDSKSGKALTAAKAAGEYEAKVVVAPWQNLDEQKWRLEKMDPKQLTM